MYSVATLGKMLRTAGGVPGLEEGMNLAAISLDNNKKLSDFCDVTPNGKELWDIFLLRRAEVHSQREDKNKEIYSFERFIGDTLYEAFLCPV